MTIALLVWLGMCCAVFFIGTIGQALERDRCGVIVGASMFFANAFFFVAMLMRVIR